jgi:hypothetical protein
MPTHFAGVRLAFVHRIDLGDWWEHPVCQYSITAQWSNKGYGHGLDRVVSRVELSGYGVV